VTAATASGAAVAVDTRAKPWRLFLPPRTPAEPAACSRRRRVAVDTDETVAPDLRALGHGLA
jgi:hypothetical protein